MNGGRANRRSSPAYTDRVQISALAAMLAAASALVGCSHRADADRLAAMLQIRPGMVVADVGAGSGWMTVMMGALVGPKGRVYSTEIDPRELAKIRGAAAAAHLDNVTVVQATASDTGLPADCCDAIILRRVYHHLTDPVDTGHSLYRALRPGGQLAVLDFRPSFLTAPWTPKGLPPNREGHGVSPVTVIGELEHAGFEYMKIEDPWPGSAFVSSFCVVFSKAPLLAAPRTSPPDDTIHGAPSY
ncbi:MAG TPA: methyltransferase domain-containing protein [Candidatus Binataceae bacterium]|jgi:ubiquinone/menaquinone biosynthesis C-methylase UbiE